MPLSSTSPSNPGLATRLINSIFHRTAKDINPSSPSLPTPPTMTPEQAASLAHWAEYGAPSTADRQAPRVTAKSWGSTKPFTEPRTAKWDILLKREDVASLIAGFQPQMMEDKWFVYSEDIMEGEGEGEPRVTGLRVCFHRSWTGIKVAEIEVELGEELDANGLAEARVTSITWESSTEFIRSPSEEYAKSTVRGVCSWVLQVAVPEDELPHD